MERSLPCGRSFRAAATPPARSAGITARARYSPLAYWKKSSPGLVDRSIALEIEARRRVRPARPCATPARRQRPRPSKQANARFHHRSPNARPSNCAQASGAAPDVESRFDQSANGGRGLPLPARAAISARLPRMRGTPAGASPSGKAPVFGTGIRRFESCRPSQHSLIYAQAVRALLANGCSTPLFATA